jgi:flagellar biosynthetic protein FliQ
MTEIIFFDTLRQGLWISVLMSAPMLAVFWVSMSFMTETLTDYFHAEIIPTIAAF